MPGNRIKAINRDQAITKRSTPAEQRNPPSHTLYCAGQFLWRRLRLLSLSPTTAYTYHDADADDDYDYNDDHNYAADHIHFDGFECIFKIVIMMTMVMTTTLKKMNKNYNDNEGDTDNDDKDPSPLIHSLHYGIVCISVVLNPCGERLRIYL